MLNRAEITGNAFLSELRAGGEISASRAHIGRQMVLRGAKLSTEGGYALSLEHTEAKGGAVLMGLPAST